MCLHKGKSCRATACDPKRTWPPSTVFKVVPRSGFGLTECDLTVKTALVGPAVWIVDCYTSGVGMQAHRNRTTAGRAN